MSRIGLRARAVLLALASLGVAWACTDTSVTGPIVRRLAAMVLRGTAFRTPYVLSGASARIDTVRIVLKRPDSTLVLDTSLFVPVGADSIAFAYGVSFQGSPDFGALLQYKSLGQVLFESSGKATASTGGAGTGGGVLDLKPLLVGPGKDVVSIAIAPRDTVVSFGGTVNYRLTALKAGNVPATQFLSVLGTSDTSVRIAANGQIVAPTARRTIWVRVSIPLPIPVADSTRVTFAPIPVGMKVQAGNAQLGTVGIALTQPIIARVVAADSLGVAGLSVTFTTSTPGVVIGTPTVLTDSLGDARTIITLGPLAGAQSFNATSSLGTRAFNATANAGAPNAMTLVSGNARTVVAGTLVDSAPTVRVTDQFGNPVSGTSVIFSITGGGGALTGANAITNAAGAANPTSWTLGLTAGANTLRATVGAVAPVNFTATGVAGPPATITKVRGDLISRVVASAVDSTPRLRVTDVGGNAVAGAAVNFSTLTGGGSVTGTTAVTDVNGFANLGAWTLGTLVGANTIRATVGALAPVTFTITGTVGAPAVLAKDGGDLRVATVATATDTAPGVLITDAFTNPVSGVAVTFAITGGGGAIAGGAQVTNAAGKARATSWTLGAAPGANTATAAAAGLTTLSFSATATVGAPSTLVIVAGNAQTAPAGSAVPIAPRVQLTDAIGNPVVGAAVTFAVTAGGGSVTGASTSTDAAGFAQVGSWTLGTTAGVNTLQVATAGVAPVNIVATGTPGAPAALVIVSGNNQAAVVNTQLATPITVVVRDANTNPVPGVNVTFGITAGGGSLSGASAVTNGVGQATLGSWTLGVVAGVNTLNATSPGVSSALFTATGIPGSAARIAFVTDSVPSAVVGTAITPPPAVLVSDLFGNAVTGAQVDWTVLTGGGIVAPAAVNTNAGGIASVTSWTLGTTVGVQSLRASVSGVGTPKTFLATALPGVAATIIKVAGDAQSSPVGTAFTTAPRVRVTDAFGNGVPGVTVTFAPQAGTSTMTGTSVQTDGTGAAQVGSWTPTAAGAVSATASTLGASTVTFTGTGTSAGTPRLVVESGALQYARAGATQLTVPVVVRALDGGGNPVAGVSIALSASSSVTGAIAGVGGPLVTAADGRITLTTFPVGSALGTIIITFTPPGPFSAVTSSALVVGQPILMLRAGGDAQSANAGDTLSQPISVFLLDGSANPIPLQPVSFSVTSGSTSGIPTSLTSAIYTVLSDANGIAALRLPMPASSGRVTITASSAGLASVSFTATSVPTAGSGTAVKVDVLNGVGTLRAAAGGLLADTIVVRELTATGNTLAGRKLWFTVRYATGGSALEDSVVTDAQGLARIPNVFVGDSAGTTTVEIYDRTINLGCGFLQSNVNISVSGVPADLELVAGDFQTAVAGTDLPQPVTVRVVDASGRPITNQVVAWTSTFPSSGGGSVAGRFGTATTDRFGIATVIFRLGGTPGTNRMILNVPGTPNITITATGTP